MAERIDLFRRALAGAARIGLMRVKRSGSTFPVVSVLRPRATLFRTDHVRRNG